ncbi:MAG: hypothetical protein U0P82_19625 [Vicinamibacterales bacterium]
MKDITLDLDARNGDLARIAAALARHHVTLKAGAAVSSGPRVVARFIPSDLDGARRALDSANVRFHESDIVPVTLEARPGELVGLITRLASGGVGVKALYLTSAADGRLELAVAPTNVARALRALELHVPGVRGVAT